MRDHINRRVLELVESIFMQETQNMRAGGHSPHNPKSHLVWAGKWGDRSSDFLTPPKTWRWLQEVTTGDSFVRVLCDCSQLFRHICEFNSAAALAAVSDRFPDTRIANAIARL
jgi:hypothetical protein